MNRKLVLIMVLSLLVGLLTVTFNIQPVKAGGTVYIRADGSVEPSDAPISNLNNVIYTFMDNINDSVVVERDNIVVDGAGYTLQGIWAYESKGISLSGRSNVTVKNMKVEKFYYGIWLSVSFNNTVSGNITNNSYGIYLNYSSGNNISRNNITNNWGHGISLAYSSGNSISENNITNNDYGIHLGSFSNNNFISGNNITNNRYGGLILSSSSNNTLRGNNMTNNKYNFGLEGYELSHFVNDVDVSNTVNEKHVYYWINVQDVVVPIDAGYVALVNCINITVQNLSLINNVQGMLLASTIHSTISQNNIANNSYGVHLRYSLNNKISGNDITNNGWGIGLELSDHNNIVGNNITGNGDGIAIWTSRSNGIIGNKIANNSRYGINIYYYSSHHNIYGNNITANKEAGIYLHVASKNRIIGNIIANNNIGIENRQSEGNSVSGNNIMNNSCGIMFRYFSAPEGLYNIFYHNNFVNNSKEIDSYMSEDLSANIWDDGYPSGGNYWSNYKGVDEKSGPNQDLPGSDGIGDTSFTIYASNRDNYPLMSPSIPSPPEHELATSIRAPTSSTRLGISLSLDATVMNQGSSDETNVELLLLINDTIADSKIIPFLQSGDSYTLSYLWTPTVKGTYNITAYAHPVPGEAYIENNQDTEFITVWAVGVKAGDWIKYDYTVTGAPPGTSIPTWMKVEILSVEGTTATVRLTMHMSDGTEGNETLTLDVARTLVYGTGGTFDTFFGFGFVIPANSTVGGDYIYIILLTPEFMLGKQIDGETTNTYAGASRIVVYATFSYIGGRYGNRPLKYYWDKQTGVMVEASATLDSMTVTAKATETNMWQAAPFGLPIEPIYLYVLVALVIIIAVGATVFLMRRKKKPPEEAKSPQI